MRPSRVGLALVLAAAAVLRFWDLGDGIPHALGVEEPQIVARAFDMMAAGTFNPRFFDYGPLHLTLQLGVSIVRFLAGATTGEWYSLAQATTDGFYTWGRALVAMFGVATVLLVFQIAMRWGSRHALLAAAMVAVAPAHVAYSQLAVPDVLLTFFVTLAFALTLGATERGTLASFAWAGAAVGLAAGSRYSGALALVMPLAACWLAPAVRPNRAAATAATLAAAFIAFVLAAPYTFLDLPAFLERFAQLAAEGRQAPPLAGGAILPLDAVLAQFGWPASLLILVGLVMAILRSVRGPGHVRWAIALSLLAVEAAAVAWRPGGDARPLLPVLPVLGVLVATGVISGVSVLRRYEFPRIVRSILIASLTLAVIAPAAWASIRHAADRSRETTVDLAYGWIRQNLKADSVVVVEASAISIPRAAANGRGVANLHRKTSEEYAREGVQYLVASSRAYGAFLSAPREYRDDYRAYMRLFAETREVARFSPGPGRPGPELRVLEVGR